jgi:hypothetical protein
MSVRRGTGIFLAVGLLALWPTLARTQEKADDELKPQIREAADRAVDYLLSKQKNGMWHHLDGAAALEKDLGATALVGLALLASDPRKCEKALSAADGVIAANINNMTETYAIAFAAIYLDKRKRANSILLSKLISGQNPQRGDWGYHCPSKNPNEFDNSNTHLAVLALLICRKTSSSAALETALRRAEKHFRTTQLTEGAWAYSGKQDGTGTISMTCAGLLGLAVSLDFARRDLEVTLKGSAAGSSKIAKAEEAYLREIQKFQGDRQVQAARQYLLGTVRSLNHKAARLTYILWSVERIAFIYGEKTFYGDFDWYDLGARILLPIQKPAGNWEIDFILGTNVDTAFALLFLRRVNLLDLNMDVVLRGGGSVRTSSPARTTKTVQGPKGTPEEARRLSEEMKTAIGPRVDEIMTILEKHTDSAYREALLDIIYNENIRPSFRNKARDALANRMMRLDADRVAKYMVEDDVELRRAAILGAERAEYTELIGNIIDRLSDRDPDIGKLAHQVLKIMTKQDFGPTPDGWKRWYEANKKKSEEKR